MLKASTRRLFAGLVATTVCAVATIVAGAAPAYAAPSGYVLIKGTGSLYTANYLVNQGGVPGGDARTFSFKFVNTGATSQQFKVTVTDYGTAMTTTLLRGSTVLPKPYYTAPIAPGGNLVLTLKVQVAAGQPQGEYDALVGLVDPETNSTIDSAVAAYNATYQAGSSSHDLFLKTGTQPFVGGSFGPQYESASAIKVGSTATFVLRMQNNSGTPEAITLTGYPGTCGVGYSVVVKQGTATVTSAVYAGTYNSGILAPGAKKELKVTIKMTAAAPCASDYFYFVATSSSGSVGEYAHVLPAT
jgi:hypothetical protein